jgi:alanine racemase
VSRTRSAWVEVDTSAIARNVRALKSCVPAGTAFMAVVKADGYGHGAAEAASAALSAGADRLGVATIDEAVALREAGITAPVGVLGEPPIEAAGYLVEHDVTATVTTREFARALDAAAAAAGCTAAFHLKIDTGMNRIGVPWGRALETVAEFGELASLELEGVLTHFATADEPGSPYFALQLERFVGVLEQLTAAGRRPALAHAANSAATILHPAAHFDMVRCGIAMYGLHPSPATSGAIELEPAMSVKARVSLVKRVSPGDGVSYGLTWRAEAPTTIATLPLGYADGVHRVLSDRMEVLIGGRRCRQVGRVCMDQLMVAVPDGVSVSQNDEAVLVGVQGGERIGMDELATRAGTINYEMACGFALRLDRSFPSP